MAVLPTGIGPVTGGYQIERSLRFNSADTAYLNRTPASAGNRKTWTWSAWVKRGALGTSQWVLAVGGSATEYTIVRFNATDTLEYVRIVSSAVDAQKISTAVYRDPSAWYHIVIVEDALNTVARIYVNGSEVAYSTNDNPSNVNGAVNNTVVHTMSGVLSGVGTNYFNGYLTEVNFVDGQAKIPSDFGETDSNTGVWKPKAYTGTYGTNGFYLPFSNNNSTVTLGFDYQPSPNSVSTVSGVNSAQLTNSTAAVGTTSLALGSQTSRHVSFTHNVNQYIYNTNFTIELWFKAQASDMNFGSQDGVLTGYNFIFSKGRTNTSAYGYGLHIYSDGKLGFEEYFGSGGGGVTTTGVNVLNNAWHHLCVMRSGSTIYIFVDGVLRGSGTLNNNTNNTYPFLISGMYDYTSGSSVTYYAGGFVDDFRFYSGIAKYSTGGFTPPSSALGLNYLTDSSWNYTIFAVPFEGANGSTSFPVYIPNNWTPNLFSVTAGAGNDSLVDSPTSYGTDTGVGGEVRGNYATLNPLRTSNAPTNGNLDVSFPTASRQIGSTIALPSSGKWYFEATLTAISAPAAQVGVSGLNYSTTNYGGQEADSYVYSSGGTKGNNNSFVAYGASWTTNDVIGVAADVDAGSLTFYKNGVSQGAAYTGISLVDKYFVVGMGGTSINFTANFGQRPFQKWNGSAYVANTAPSGFKALCTQNLPTPTIGATSTTQANKYMDVTLYTGNGAVRSITNSGSMQPDFVWDKLRSGSNSHRLFDAVRGVEKALYSNLTNAEATETGTLTSFNSNGFSLGTSTETNTNGSTYVAWQWNAGGSNATNTSGTITSTVRANTTSGFSIVTYTGTSANATVGHGLGATPAMIMVKNRDSGAIGGAVYHTSMGATKYLKLFQTTTGSDGEATDNTAWNGSSPTFNTNVFSVGSLNRTNSSQQMVAYCFASVAGYSAFGSYTGNGSADGPFVYTGFRPRYVMIKKSTAVDSWEVRDSARSPENVADDVLFANLSNAEVSGARFVDLLSNGFKLRSTDGGSNTSSATYIYAAFAESPFKYSLAR